MLRVTPLSRHDQSPGQQVVLGPDPLGVVVWPLGIRRADNFRTGRRSGSLRSGWKGDSHLMLDKTKGIRFIVAASRASPDDRGVAGAWQCWRRGGASCSSLRQGFGWQARTGLRESWPAPVLHSIAEDLA